MKKNKNHLKSLLFLAFVSVISSCSQSIVDEMGTEKIETAKVSDFHHFGDLHNQFMSNVQKNFTTGDKTIKNVNDGINCILDFNISFAKTLDSKKTGIDTHEILKDLSYYKNLVKSQRFEMSLIEKSETRAVAFNDGLDDLIIDDIQSPNTLQPTKSVKKEFTMSDFETLVQDTILEVDDLPEVKSMVKFMHEKQIISNESNQYLQSLLTLIDKSVAGLISDEQFEKELDKMITEIDNKNYSKDNPTINTIGPVFALSKSSLEWWEDNPEAIALDGKIPHVVAMDAAGAIVGVAWNLGLCWYNDSSPSWGGIGASAFVGAVNGSTGVVGKVAKLISRF